MEQKIEAAETLAQYAASLKYEDIPTEVRESAKPLPSQNIEMTIDIVSHLEEIDNVSQVVQILA